MKVQEMFDTLGLTPHTNRNKFFGKSNRFQLLCVTLI
jgi:hypothetical protein